MKDESRGLGTLFDALNRRYFGGRLPKYRVVRSRLPGPCDGKMDEDRHLIRLSGGLSPEMRRQTLLHEMCHIGIPGHGTRWQARMLRLADAGEAWARDEVRAYRTNAETPRMVWGAITDALHELAAHRPCLRLAQVRRICANDYGLTVTEFREEFPRFDRAWARACAEEAEYRTIRGDHSAYDRSRSATERVARRESTRAR